MRKQVIKATVIAVFAMLGILNAHAQGKAPWTVTKQWVLPNDGDLYIEAWIFGKKAKGRCDVEPNTICNGGVTITYKDNVMAYAILNYAGKNSQGYIYNAVYKEKSGSTLTGKLLMRVKGSIETGPSIAISAFSDSLNGCGADGIVLVGTPTAMDE